MKLPDVKLDSIADPAFTKVWEEHEKALHEHIGRMREMVEIAMEHAALCQLGSFPTNAQITEYGACVIHLDGRREYKWAGKTVAVMHPWEGPLPPRVEFP